MAEKIKKTGINKLKKSLKKTTIVRRRSIPTGVLNRVVLETVAKHSIILKKTSGKPFKVKYASMLKSDPPTFLLFSNGKIVCTGTKSESEVNEAVDILMDILKGHL